MHRYCIAVFVLVIAASSFGEAVAREAHIEGSKARQLISILVSGNAEALNHIAKDKNIVLRDLQVLSQATSKFDPDDARYRVEIYSAWGNIGNSTKQSDIREATSLWTFLSNLGFTTDTAMEGSFLDLTEIDCSINTSVDFSDLKRFHCDLENPY